ncbi:antitoxin of toxin-antitoxin stability system [Asticcacaulis sp. AND118]|uniref:antitoxin of toxin-antitoxin stability system n=1 Tax=Asticcacaulis sp. AND118 TaxID=2840468 RepID=UPI001CFF6A3B|nr:antitoxin of toxin-antitoxin stability system [Asticcacaulis sp. AND118]UDF05525.1 antitoxin of toxin-antitoxin stability system [Asticcacaulis sp. AND118]
MSKDAVFTMKIEPELREAFMAEAAAAHRPASQIVRDFMRDFVERQKKDREYDAWFRAEVEAGLKEADDPNTVWYTQAEVEADMDRQRQDFMARLKARGE